MQLRSSRLLRRDGSRGVGYILTSNRRRSETGACYRDNRAVPFGSALCFCRFSILLSASGSQRDLKAATEPQLRGWPEIAAGRDILISAPTGSGKTLAAFLICLDRLIRAARAGELTDETQVVYVSPLKALSNDVHKNLEIPLAEIAALAKDKGIPLAADSHRGSHGRHTRVRASADAQGTAAHSRYDA